MLMQVHEFVWFPSLDDHTCILGELLFHRTRQSPEPDNQPPEHTDARNQL